MEKQLTSFWPLAIWLLLLQSCGGGATPIVTIGAQSEITADEVFTEITATSEKPVALDIPVVAGAESEKVVSDSDAHGGIGVDTEAESDVDIEVASAVANAPANAVIADDASADSTVDPETENAISKVTDGADTEPNGISPGAGDDSSDVTALIEAIAVAVVEYEIIPTSPFAVPADSDSAEALPSNDTESALVADKANAENAGESIQLIDGAEELIASDIAGGDESDLAAMHADKGGVESITDLIFLTGQSNAASLVTKYDARLDSPDERVFAYTDQGWQVADLHQFWDEGIPGNFSADNPEREPYNNIIFQVGKALAESADRRVGIVMLTAPGEGISHWDYDGLFYNKVRDHAISALNAVPHKSSYDALVWMQGETDWLLHGTADPDVPDFESYESEDYRNYYPRKLTQLIESMRTDPWYGDSALFICTETIKAALNPHLMALNDDNDPLTGCAVASDLAARENDPQGNHFSADSLRVLGKRLADVYLALQP